MNTINLKDFVDNATFFFVFVTSCKTSLVIKFTFAFNNKTLQIYTLQWFYGIRTYLQYKVHRTHTPDKLLTTENMSRICLPVVFAWSCLLTTWQVLSNDINIYLIQTDESKLFFSDSIIIHHSSCNVLPFVYRNTVKCYVLRFIVYYYSGLP